MNTVTKFGRYAIKTDVPVRRSRDEIENLLAKYGGESFAYAQDSGRAIIGFRITADSGRKIAVKMELPLPDRSKSQAHLEQLQRSRWRALVLVVKAKLEACASGISTVEKEFMADLVMPDGRTLTQHLGLQIDHMLTTNNRNPLMLTGPDDGDPG